jgi:tetratricopeptide (TPR) repeat protein
LLTFVLLSVIILLVAEQVALNDYLDEIGTQVQSRSAVEALALCKYILRQFPKHLDTYRLMASVLVELRDPNGALDIYRRVLSADPENVDAHVGTAQILAARSQLEDALWYMERAFELAPTRADIRQDLSALYARAEGKPRGRLKLTRAALARLYVQEGLLPQAVREFRELSNETPSRYDVRVALAEALWRSEQTRQAAEVAQSLLDPLPYCLKANLILGTAWRESAIEESDGYLERAQALDPSNRVANQLLGDRSPLAPVQIRITRYEEAPPSPRLEREKDLPGVRERMAIEEANFEIPPLIAPDQVAPERDQELESADSLTLLSPAETANIDAEQELQPAAGGSAEDAPVINFDEPLAEREHPASPSETDSAPVDSWRETRQAEPGIVAENYLGEQPTEAKVASEIVDEALPSDTESPPSLQTTAFPSDEPSASVEESLPEEAAREAEAGTTPHEEEIPTWLSGVSEEAKAEDKRVEEEEMPPWLDGAKAEASAKPEPAPLKSRCQNGSRC